jgi:putative acetyltransferase
MNSPSPTPSGLVIDVGDPRDPDVADLLDVHLGFAHSESPPEHVHALPVERLAEPDVTFVSARDADGGVLLGVGALKQLSPRHGEVKSMHTRAGARGRGVARAVLTRLLEMAGERGYDRVSLETGSTEAFAPARALYASAGFVRCPPFAQYTDNEFSICMTLALEPRPRR